MYKLEINAVQMKFLREFFDNYKDDKVELKLNGKFILENVIKTIDKNLNKLYIINNNLIN